MEVYQPDLITFPLPPKINHQNSLSRGHADYLKNKLGRSASIPKMLQSIDINLNSLDQTISRESRDLTPTDEMFSPAFSTSSTSSSSRSGSLRNDTLHALPRLPQEPVITSVQSPPSVSSARSEDLVPHPAKVPQPKCARYPITYKMKTNTVTPRIPAQPNSSPTVLRVKSLYDTPKSNHEHMAQLAMSSSPDLPTFSSASSSSQPPLVPVIRRHDPSSHWSHSTYRSKPNSSQRPGTVPSLIPPPRFASLHCLPRRPSLRWASTYNCTASSRGTHDESQLESIHATQQPIEFNESEHTTTSRKSSVLDRPRPLMRSRGQSFSNHSADYDRVMTLHALAKNGNSPIHASRHPTVRPPRPSISTSRPSSTFQGPSSECDTPSSNAHLLYNLRPVTSFATEPSPATKTTLVYGQKPRRVSRWSFFTSLASLDPEGSTLNLDLKLPSSPSGSAQLKPSPSESEAQITRRNSRTFGGSKLRNQNSSCKAKSSYATLEQQDIGRSTPILPSLPNPVSTSPTPSVETQRYFLAANGSHEFTQKIVNGTIHLAGCVEGNSTTDFFFPAAMLIVSRVA
ncbi:hypothetical protein PCASD_24688 [Puccinia coronata f. sp. avenae]|uniref:Uncharacterized protein n=1 Tax=Puccinia coronata f. sp. avenae TaxID=200324 RepID=A0A2N5TKV8_9BASI|nr:hypothetical protein PCASD_24688 [Puccinia coronata f. sp. avenae]